MGACCSTTKDSSEEINILVLGLNGSGKTEILHVLVNQERTDISPTNGSRVFNRQLGKFKAVFTEVGGNEDMRKIWHHYYPKAHAIIYVIDLYDEGVINESFRIFTKMIKHNYVQGKSILVLVNKTDLCPEQDAFDIYERFPFAFLANNYKTRIVLKCCGRNDYTKLHWAIDDWLRFQIDFDYEQLKNRVLRDIESEKPKTEPLSDDSHSFTIAQVRSRIGCPSSTSTPCSPESLRNINYPLRRTRRMLGLDRIGLRGDEAAPEFSTISDDSDDGGIELKPIRKSKD